MLGCLLLTPFIHWPSTNSCLKQWIHNASNANSNSCPACRTAATHATASRTIQSIVDLLVRNRPDLQRTERERQQADEICPPCAEIKVCPLSFMISGALRICLLWHTRLTPQQRPRLIYMNYHPRPDITTRWISLNLDASTQTSEPRFTHPSISRARFVS